MTREELSAIEARAEAATPGPWRADGNSPRKVRDADGDTFARIELPPGSTADEIAASHATATFIAHARTDIPALIAHIRTLEAERDRALVERNLYRAKYGPLTPKAP